LRAVAVVLAVRERVGDAFFTLALEEALVALGLLRCVLFSFCADTGVAKASTSATPKSVARVLEVVLNMMNLPFLLRRRGSFFFSELTTYLRAMSSLSAR
jgi:hypothetical protein